MKNLWDMSVFVASAIIMSSLFMSVVLFYRNRQHRELTDRLSFMTPWIFLSEAAVLVSDMLAGPGGEPKALVLDVSTCLIPLIVTTSTLWTREQARYVVLSGILGQLALSAYWLMVAAEVFDSPPDKNLIMSSMMMAVSVAGLYISALFLRIRDVKAVMKSGTVWQNVGLCVESIYVTFTLVNVILYCVACSLFSGHTFFQCMFSVLIGIEAISLGIRSSFGSMFVLWSRHERRIVESLKISHVEVSNDGTKGDEQYKDIYERLVAYFEESKPFLNGDLTLNDVVKVVFTNKLYISRAISLYTGRNFCQFVNYYRVTYSVHLFRNNPDMKIVELANASGFNSVVSFNMAFRLYMNENPSDWCRKERLRFIRNKNKLWNR